MSRAKVVEEWARDGGVLLMGYEMYRLLSLKKSFVTGRKRKSKKPAGPIIIDLDEEDRQQELMKGFYSVLKSAAAEQHTVMTRFNPCTPGNSWGGAELTVPKGSDWSIQPKSKQMKHLLFIRNVCLTVILMNAST